MEWCSFNYKGDDRVALLVGEDERGIECMLAWQVSKAGNQDPANVGFRSFKHELILRKLEHPPLWDLVPAEVQEEIARIEAAAVADRPSLTTRFLAWLRDFKKVVG